MKKTHGGPLPSEKDYKSYYWVTTSLVRESGPWYAKPMQSPSDVYNIVSDHISLKNFDREHFIVAYLNRKGGVNAICTISIGGLNSTMVHPREVFKPAILTSSASVILIHNHPSGDPTPSSEDIEITKRLIEAGELLGIEVLDHVIVGADKYLSLKAEGFI